MSTKTELIIASRNSFKYRVDVKDCVYGTRRTQNQKNAFRIILAKFGVIKIKYQIMDQFGDLFIKLNNDETICYYEDYSRFGPYYCVVGFKNRQQSIAFRNQLNALRVNS